MDEIERKVDMLISGIVLPRKRTRRRVATIATTVLIAMTLIASASLISFYYKQTGEVDVTSLVTITDPDNNVHDAGWEETKTIGGTEVFYEGTEYISGIYTIAYADVDPPGGDQIIVYIHITVTETLSDGVTPGNGAGLTVEVHNGSPPGSTVQIPLNPGESDEFTIHVKADAHINATSTYGYTITMDWHTP